jgi:hypothetical protein
VASGSTTSSIRRQPMMRHAVGGLRTCWRICASS